MEYRNLGSAGIRVSPLCIGTMMFGPWGTQDHDESVRVLRRAMDGGVNFFDTANEYAGGECEVILGKAIAGRRDRVVVATKVMLPVGAGPNDRRASRVHILREVERSLARLGTDYVDVYQIHWPDRHTPIEETLRALDDLVRSGKVRYIGSSNFAGWELARAQWVSDRLGLNHFVSEQPPYNILEREVEREVLPACAAFGLGVFSYSPLAGNRLTGRYRKGTPFPKDSYRTVNWTQKDDEWFARKLDVIEALVPLANELGVSLARYAVAWTLANPAVTAPIVGPRTMEQLEDLLPAVELRLPAEHLARIDELVPRGTNVDPRPVRYGD